MWFRLLRIAIIATAALSLFPSFACAAEQDHAELVDRTVTTVSGTRLAEDVIGSLESVELGSDSTTVKLDVDGEQQAVKIEYDELLNEAGVEDGAGSLVPLALLSAGLGILFRFVRVLTRLAR